MEKEASCPATFLSVISPEIVSIPSLLVFTFSAYTSPDVLASVTGMLSEISKTFMLPEMASARMLPVSIDVSFMLPETFPVSRVLAVQFSIAISPETLWI